MLLQGLQSLADLVGAGPIQVLGDQIPDHGGGFGEHPQKLHHLVGGFFALGCVGRPGFHGHVVLAHGQVVDRQDVRLPVLGLLGRHLALRRHTRLRRRALHHLRRGRSLRRGRLSAVDGDVLRRAVNTHGAHDARGVVDVRDQVNDDAASVADSAREVV